MSKFIPIAAGALAAVLLLPAAPQVANAKDYIINYSDIGGNKGPRAAALNVWAKAVEMLITANVHIIVDFIIFCLI